MRKRNSVAFFNILSTVILNGLSIFTAPLISRLLGTSGYGVVSIYTIWVAAVQIVFALQTQNTLGNARVEYAEDAQKGYQSSVLSLSVVTFLLLSVPVLLLREQLAVLLKLPVGMIPLLLLHAFGGSCILFLNSKFTYELKADRNFFLSLALALITLGTSVALILWMPEGQEYWGRILSMSLTYGLIGIGGCVYVLAGGRHFYDRKYWKFCLTLSLPMIFYNLSDLVLGQSDRLMLQRMLSDAAVGQYSLAYNFGGIMFTIFGAVNNAWFPFFFDDMKQGRKEEIRIHALNYLELFTVLSVGFILLHREVYHVFAGREFWEGTALIPIFVTGYYLNFLCTFPVNFEYYNKKTKAVAVITICCSLVNIGLNYVLIRLIGTAGAAMATAIAHGLQLMLHYLYCTHVLGKGSYPFPVGMWVKYAAVYFAVLAFVMLVPGLGLARWALGAAIGAWEVWRIWKRKVLL